MSDEPLQIRKGVFAGKFSAAPLDINNWKTRQYVTFLNRILTRNEFELFRPCFLSKGKNRLKLFQQIPECESRYFDVCLKVTGAVVELRFLENNLYLVAFRPQNATHFYQLDGWVDEKREKYVGMPLMMPTTPSIHVHYNHLQSGSTDRENLLLGLYPLQRAVQALSSYKADDKLPNYAIKDHLHVIILMTSEALRFTEIRKFLCSNFEKCARLPATLVYLPNDFSHYSKVFFHEAVKEIQKGTIMSKAKFNKISIFKQTKTEDVSLDEVRKVYVPRL